MRKLMMILAVAMVATFAAESMAQGPFVRARVRREVRFQNDLNRLAFARAGFIAPVGLRAPLVVVPRVGFVRAAPFLLPAQAAFIQPATVFSPSVVSFGRQFIQPATSLIVPQFFGSASCF